MRAIVKGLGPRGPSRLLALRRLGPWLKPMQDGKPEISARALVEVIADRYASSSGC